MLLNSKESRFGVLYMKSMSEILGTSIKRKASNQEGGIIHINVNNGEFFLMETKRYRLP